MNQRILPLLKANPWETGGRKATGASRLKTQSRMPARLPEERMISDEISEAAEGRFRKRKEISMNSIQSKFFP